MRGKDKRNGRGGDFVGCKVTVRLVIELQTGPLRMMTSLTQGTYILDSVGSFLFRKDLTSDLGEEST